MNYFYLLFLSFCLTSCGGGEENLESKILTSNNSQPLEKPSVDIIDTSFKSTTPFFIRDLKDNITQEAPSDNSWSFSVRYLGGDVLNLKFKENYLTEYKTGLKLNNDAPIYGNNYAYGSFFRSYFNNFESFIDTTNSPLEKIVGGGEQSMVQYTLKNQIKATNFNISADFKIPFIQATNSVGQLSFVGYLTDNHQHYIAFVIGLFDNRFNTFSPYVDSDTYTAFFSQPIQNNKYATSINNNTMIKNTSLETNTFGMKMTENNIKNIIEDVNIFNKKTNIPLISTNIDDYYLTSVGILQEVFLFDNPNNYIKFGYSMQNLQLNFN